MKKIIMLVAMMAVSGVAHAGYFRGLDLNHPQTSLGTFSDFKSHSDAGGSLALITHSPADGCIIPGFCINWTPLAIGGAIGNNLGGASIGVGPSANLLPAAENIILIGVNALFPAADKAMALKKLLKPSVSGNPDISVAAGPCWSLVFVDGLHSKGMWTFFTGAAWKW